MVKITSEIIYIFGNFIIHLNHQNKKEVVSFEIHLSIALCEMVSHLLRQYRTLDRANSVEAQNGERRLDLRH